MIPFLDIAGQNAQCADALTEASSRVLKSGYFVLGPELEAFEAELASSQGVRYAIGVGNGLDAVTVALMALGIGPGDEVIVPAHTFIATWLAVTRVGATIVPVDVRADTYNLDEGKLDAAVTSRTAAIVPVHLYGCPADMDAINRVARRNRLVVVADGAQSIGAQYRGKPIAAHATATTLSFYPAKNLGAFGDGGAVLTDDPTLAEQVRLLRNYGSPTKYTHQSLGLNSRLDELQAALLRVKLPYLGTWNRRRTAIASHYSAGLQELDLVLPAVTQHATPVWHLFVIRVSSRSRVQDALTMAGIQTLIHYPKPPGHQEAYADRHFQPYPVTDKICDEILSLPMGPTLTDSEVAEVVECLSVALPT